MCTVSFVPLEKGVVITSSRDEHIGRGIAADPGFYELKGRRLVYPKDSKAGGTWFISNESGDAAVLLNGAFEKHTAMPPYRKSRGFILPEIFQSNSPVEALKRYNLNGIENFTIILWQQEILHEFKWDGEKLHVKLPDKSRSHIWSSVTLYDEDMIFKRHCWFYDWLKYCNNITQEDIVNFHSNTHVNNREYGLRISRSNQIATCSISSLLLENKKAILYYRDLIQNTESELAYDLMPVRYILTPTFTNSETA